MRLTLKNITFLVFFLATPSFAEIESSSEFTTEKWSSNFKSEFFGPPISTLDAPHRLDHSLAMRYRLSQQVSAGVTALAEFTPLRNGDFKFKDPFATIRDHRLVDLGAFTTSGQIRLYPGVSELSRKSSILAALRFVTDSIYRIPQTSFRVALNAYAHVPWFNETPASARDRKVYLAPRLEYRISPSWRTLATYKHWSSHRVGKPFFDWSSDLSLVQLAAIWQASPSILVMPSLDLNRISAITADTTTFGALVSVDLL